MECKQTAIWFEVALTEAREVNKDIDLAIKDYIDKMSEAALKSEEAKRQSFERLAQAKVDQIQLYEATAQKHRNAVVSELQRIQAADKTYRETEVSAIRNATARCGEIKAKIASDIQELQTKIVKARNVIKTSEDRLTILRRDNEAYVSAAEEFLKLESDIRNKEIQVIHEKNKATSEMIDKVLNIGLPPSSCTKLIQLANGVTGAVKNIRLVASDPVSVGEAIKMKIANAIAAAREVGATEGADAIKMLCKIFPLLRSASPFGNSLGCWPSLAFYYYADRMLLAKTLTGTGQLH